MIFQRRNADNWQRDVPGARWLKADLHIHTIDDHPGGRVKLPHGLGGNPTSQKTIAAYARQFVQALVHHGVQVAGLTPHSPRMDVDPETSAVWTIVREWNEGIDDDGIPFREKIYAIFPGFEPSFKDGKEGLHLLFLFDPEIGQARFLKAFDLVMGGISPWRDRTLQISGNRAGEAFVALREFWERERSAEESDELPWNYLVLAPHIEAPKGLLGGQKAQVLQLFDHDEITGLELGDEKLPGDTLKGRPWLREGMEEHRQAFFHASDAYGLPDIARRHTWMKLASPRIEGLRQAFVASDSRMLIGFTKRDDGLEPINDPPDVMVSDRPWLREATVSGGASFFGGNQGGKPRKVRFRLSPDLTCIIGGSMTGKSTLLDGLRVHVGAAIPTDPAIRTDVIARGQNFSAGVPDIVLDCPGTDPTACAKERWPAQFFAQSELQRLTREGAAVENILSRLIPSESAGIAVRNEELRVLDAGLSKEVEELRKLDDQLAEAEQALERSKAAKEALAVFSEAGVEELHRARRDRQLWEDSRRSAASVQQTVANAIQMAGTLEIPKVEHELTPQESSSQAERGRTRLAESWTSVVELLQRAEQEIGTWARTVSSVVSEMTRGEAMSRARAERALAERGYDTTKLQEFQNLDRQASLLSSHRSNLDHISGRRDSAQALFDDLEERRRRTVKHQRRAFDRVSKGIERDNDRIRVRRVDDGDLRQLELFLEGLRQRGVTRWWNGLDDEHKPSPALISASLKSDSLKNVGMSDAVRQTFSESMTRAKRRELSSIRCPDRYVLEMRMDDGGHRCLDELSGGQRVSVLLSLLLETADDRPLVIDQPEDELDNRFLSDTVLPALKKLRGRRQVIVATHNANIVVNGDADMVIQLEASAWQGRVACAGTIDQPEIRDAIVRTVDGGKDAFRLRRRKYGF